MANSGGGLIVFGIGEEGAEKHLAAAPFELTPEPEQSIHQILATRVRPLVRPIVEAVHVGNQQEGYLLVQVPDSTNAPHFYEHKSDLRNAPAAPFRHGSGTEIMREREIERAYLARFARQGDLNTRLSNLLARSSRRASPTSPLGETNTRWIAIAVAPYGSVPLAIGDPDSRIARDVIFETSIIENSLQSADLPSLLDPIANDCRSGLRRWTFQYHPPGASAFDSALQFADLHYDGRMLLANPVALPRDGQPGDSVRVSLLQAERTIGAGVLLARAWMQARRITDGAAVRVTMWKPGNPEAMTSLHVSDHSMNGLTHGNNPLLELEEIDASVPASKSDDDLLATATELALGFAHQFGQQKLHTLRARTQELSDRPLRP
ncbi:hypothetical protein SAMN05216184_11017 [Georgenia satyanarayanai]|uniref:DNA-binding domain-containing protein n=2 Tax=Georgenia satyanarayanai TaxID=860221 RepID=A0A2Y9AN21_9MICO|nr:hypothetical protein A8987_11017 [Georgenia satyanarayanai]SSA44728.1 hypothetical protein SAMN05216184_11017 [Georgenia satyanarayanai]